MRTAAPKNGLGELLGELRAESVSPGLTSVPFGTRLRARAPRPVHEYVRTFFGPAAAAAGIFNTTCTCKYMYNVMYNVMILYLQVHVLGASEYMYCGTCIHVVSRPRSPNGTGRRLRLEK